jgi:transposase
MGYFAQPVLGRDQRLLIPLTLDDAIPLDHEVRVLDEILELQDWSAWESEYCQRRGQPPLHPRMLASVILYGQMRRVRSSRVLEYMTGHNIDFMWLTEGRTIDYTTLCKFRKRFKKQLRELFRSLVQIAMRMGMVRLGEVTFDGTRAKANNDRYETIR